MATELIITTDDRVKFLRDCDIGEGLPESVLLRIANIASALQLNAGDTLTEEGTDGHHLYIITKGAIEVQLAPNDLSGSASSRMLPAGSIIGEMSIIESNKRTARTIATERTTLLCIRDQDLWQLFDDDSHAGYLFMRNLAKVLSHRLRQTNLAIRHNFFA